MPKDTTDINTLTYREIVAALLQRDKDTTGACLHYNAVRFLGIASTIIIPTAFVFLARSSSTEYTSFL